jgi:anti-sigma regulatory factor (Ser/Thr protein kinase)
LHIQGSLTRTERTNGREMPSADLPSHQALFYRDDREYLEGLKRFLAPAVTAGEPVALALPGPKLKLACKALSDVADKKLLDMSEVGRNPGRILSVIDRLRAEHCGQTLHYVGEPIWPGRRAEEIREAVRHEALINVAVAGTRTRVLCPYDATGLDAAVLASAERTHPTVVERDTPRPSDRYSGNMPRECELPLSIPPAEAVSCDLDQVSLSAVRALVRDYGEAARIDGEVVDTIKLVASELASNALRHGAPPRELTLWRASGKVICQVDNEGAISDPLAGRRNPQPDSDRGMGLWIVHQLSDLVEVRNGARTTIRAHVAEATDASGGTLEGIHCCQESVA